MQEQGILARNGKAFNYGSHALAMHNVAYDLLWRDFSTDRPSQKWVTDITYVWVRNHWLYLATVWSLYTSMTEKLVTQAMQMAIYARGVSLGLIVHSGRGTQYRSNCYVSFLEKHSVTRSMSRKGNFWDNAVIRRGETRQSARPRPCKTSCRIYWR